MLNAACLPRNELILECYHPSAKISTPYLSCHRIGAATLDGNLLTDDCERLADVQQLYSSFRPAIIENNRQSWRFRTSIMNSENEGEESQSQERSCPREEVFLDTGESFSQLCTVTNVVKEGPKHGLFVSHVNVSDGVIRVWREWLATRVVMSSEAQNEQSDDDRILWADRNHHVGIRFQVLLGPTERMPLLSSLDNDEPVSYTLEYKGQSQSMSRAPNLTTDAWSRAAGQVDTTSACGGKVRGAGDCALGQGHHYIVNMRSGRTRR